MFGSQVLDVGIGLAMLFAFMSLIATALNEALETVLKARAKQLEQGIRNILNDPNGDKIATEFFNNPLISILYPGNYDPAKLSPPANKAAPAPGDSARNRYMPRSARKDLPSYIPSANFALAVLSVAASCAPTSAADVTNKINVTLAKSPQLKAVILQALASGGDDLAQTQKFLENWFDSAMDRVSGWYKRRSQFILFCIGLFAAVALNVDTIMVARSLISDTALRQTVVNHAAGHAAATELNFKDSRDALMSMGYPIGWTNLPQLQPGLWADSHAGQGADSLKDDLNKKPCDPWECVSRLSSNPGLALKTVPPMILGWLITALAITLGAPFWFDLLSKFMQVRAAGKSDPPGPGGGAQTPATASPAPKAAPLEAGLGALDQLALAPVIAAGQAAFVAEQWADGTDRGMI